MNEAQKFLNHVKEPSRAPQMPSPNHRAEIVDAIVNQINNITDSEFDVRVASYPYFEGDIFGVVSIQEFGSSEQPHEFLFPVPIGTSEAGVSITAQRILDEFLNETGKTHDDFLM